MSRTYKLGLIGCGNMGSALLRGIKSAGVYQPSEMIFSEASGALVKEKEAAFGVTGTCDNAALAKNSDIIAIVVKPQHLNGVADQIREVIEPDQIIVVVAAGRTIASIKEVFTTLAVAGSLKIVRTMPNTPAMVGESMTALCVNDHMEEEDIAKVKAIFSAIGRVEVVDESMMDLITGLSGSGPAFIYMLIEAMADEAVRSGMARNNAYLFASQTVLGSAKMVRDTGQHPGKLKDLVCSPGGTTIAGVCALEEAGFRDAIMKGVRAATNRSMEMTK
ncbi:MAG: pyrroline-5-carboxylate reductase [Lachnospiraceae bacterium]|nr:pyrroline-5-carboxylate reductase [Lachnospiraceae bacterium]